MENREPPLAALPGARRGKGLTMAGCFRISGETLLLDIKVIPGASKSQLIGVKEGRLRLRIAAAAEDGRANACLRSFLAKTLDCPKRDIILTRGEKSPLKTIALPLSLGGRLEKVIAGMGKNGGPPGEK